MVKRIRFTQADCPVARSVDALGDRWSLLILRDAFDGIGRFSELQQSLGVSRGILTTRLHNLVALGILQTVPASDGSAYQEYVLTQKGRDLFAVVVGLRQWGEDYCYKPGEPHSVLVETKTGRKVARLEVRSRTGQALTPADTMVKKVVRSE